MKAHVSRSAAHQSSPQQQKPVFQTPAVARPSHEMGEVTAGRLLQMKKPVAMRRPERSGEQGDVVASGTEPSEPTMQQQGLQVTAEQREAILRKAFGNPVQRREAEPQAENKTGLPDPLKAGVEQLSGYDLSGVRVNYNSPKPAAVQAHAYTQGQTIEVARGQEKHLPHEAWHVVQQMQGRVKPTREVNGAQVNDDRGLEREASVMGGRAVQMREVEKRWDSSPYTVGESDRTCETLQRVAIKRFPIEYRKDFNPRYQTWRDILWGVTKPVYGKYTIKQIMKKINDTDATHIGELGLHKHQNQNFLNERDELNRLMQVAKDSYDGNGEETDEALQPFTDFVRYLDSFLDKWDETYGEEQKKEKKRLAEVLVRVTTSHDLDIYWFKGGGYDSELIEYTEKLIEETLSDSRLIATLRGKDSYKLHIQDDDPEEIKSAIKGAAQDLRGAHGHNFNDRMKPTADTEWRDWRQCDCVFAAIIYTMNNNIEKYESVLGQNPAVLGAEDAEKNETETIADQLNLSYGVVEDPALFRVMKRLGWIYQAGETWNSWVNGNKYTPGVTYIISYSRAQDGSSNHTVVFKDGNIYDRQGKRLNNQVNREPMYKDQPMEIWTVDTESAKSLLK